MNENNVTITKIDLKFWDMVNFMVKWALASIPAAFILSLAFFSFLMFLAALGFPFR